MAKNKNDRIQELALLNRQLCLATFRFNFLVAEKAGLAGGDHKYLYILLSEGTMTAGELANKTGLTTGAITGVIDRLEKHGFISREHDPSDRRKVIVVPNHSVADKKLGPSNHTLHTSLLNVNSKFTINDLNTVKQFIENTIDTFQSLSEELNA